MPRRKQRKTSSKTVKSVKPMPFAQRHERFTDFRWGESYTSLLLGIVVIIIAVLFGVSIFRQANHLKQITALQTGPTSTVTSSTTPTPTEGAVKIQNEKKVYTVQSGDDLWTISEKFYKSGYNWVDIANANNLSNPGSIYAGNQLVIPNVTPKIATVSVSPTLVSSYTITGSTYTVQKDDDLWDIAVRAYGDGYRWVDIAKANKLSNPDIIHSGNILTIPR